MSYYGYGYGGWNPTWGHPFPYGGGAMGWGGVAYPTISAQPQGFVSGLYSSAYSSMHAPMGMNAGLYTSVSGVRMPAPVNIYSSVPHLPQNRSGRKGTVGLMLWPGTKSSDLCVTGTADGTSAHASKIEVGDVIESVDGRNIKGLTPEEVASLMAGDLNTYVTIKTTSGVEARLKRDVSAEEADQATVSPKKKVESGKAAPAKSSPVKSTTSIKSDKVGMKLTPEECAKHGVKEGATWGPGMGHFAPRSAIYRMPFTQTVEVKGVQGTQV